MPTSPTSEIRAAAIRLLSRREHSCCELQRKLSERKFSREQIETILSDLIAENLLSDERFTESYIRMRAAKGFGPNRIAEELRERGINKELIAEQLKQSSHLWSDRIEIVYQKKFGKKIKNDLNERAKAIRFLQYRGFSFEQISVFLKDASSFDIHDRQ